MGIYKDTFKDDWDNALWQMSSWWQGVNAHPLLQIFCSKEKVLPSSFTDKQDWYDYHLNSNTVLAREEKRFEKASFMGVAMPCLLAWQGHSIAAFLGSDMRCDEQTVWLLPCYSSVNEEFDIRKWRENYLWHMMQKEVSLFACRSERKYGVGYHIGGVIHAIATMRGETGFLTDIVDYPEQVEKLRDKLLNEWFIMAEHLERILPVNMGYWIPFCIWAPERAVFCECDISCTFSPAMFRKFVVPEVMRLAEWAKYSIYHLDGPGAIKHVDSLLGIKELNGIQWIRGAGGGKASDWIPLLQKIQKNNKILYVESPMEEVNLLIKNLKPEGLFIAVEDCSSVEEAERLLKDIEKL